MLSRVAGSLHRVGSELERADHLARVLDVHMTLALDRGGRVEEMFWGRVRELAAAPPERGAGMRSTLDALVNGPSPSITAAVTVARREATSVRPSLSSEVYEAVNQLYWDLTERVRETNFHDFCIGVQRGVQLAWGLVDDTMSHDEAWDFIRLGKALERAQAVGRLVTRKLSWLAGDPDPLEWAAVLRSCSAFEAYRWRFSAPVTPARAAGFLLLDEALPRSTRHAVSEALASLRRIDAGSSSAPHRLLGRLHSLLQYSVEDDVASDPAGFTVAFEGGLERVHQAVAATYFRPTAVPIGRVVVPPPAWVSSSQQ